MQTEETRGRRGSVLVVDDDLEFVQLITRTLGAPPRAYQVHQASSGAVGLELLRSARPDAVVLDLLLPDLDGYAVLHHIRTDQTLFDTPVIVVSAQGYEPETIHAELLGVVQAAGFTVAELVAWLRTSLGVLAV